MGDLAYFFHWQPEVLFFLRIQFFLKWQNYVEKNPTKKPDTKDL